MTTHRTSVTVQNLGVLRTIFVYYPEPISFTCADRNGRRGETVGFKYSDDHTADIEPALLAWKMQPIGDEFRKDGVPVVHKGYGWQSAARKIANLWIADNPDWWKSTNEDPDQSITDIAWSIS